MYIAMKNKFKLSKIFEYSYGWSSYYKAKQTILVIIIINKEASNNEFFRKLLIFY